MLCNSLRSSSSCDFNPEYQNSGEFGAKGYFTDHRTAKKILGFRDSFLALKIRQCYSDTQTNEQFSPIQAIATKRLQCVDVNSPLQTVFKRVYTVYTYSNCMINHLLYC